MTAADRPRTSPRPLAWVDGRVLPASEATVPLLDDGFLRGDAVFDAALVRRGRTHALDAHLDRLRSSARQVGIRLPPLRQVVTDLLAAFGEHDGSIRLIVTRSGTVRGIVGPTAWPDVLSLSVVPMPWRSALTGVKTLSYAANQWALHRARQAHADDALIVDDTGIVLELPTGSVCVVREGRIATPDPERVPILDSVTVRSLRDVIDVDAEVLTVDDVRAADEVFVVSATRPVLPVHAIDDREYDAPGPVTAHTRGSFAEHIDATLDP